MVPIGTRTDASTQRPNASQLAVAKKLTDSKVVTVVVGQGPHVVQPIERVNGKFVVFSEGNLVSNQAASTGLPAATQDGIVALLRFRGSPERTAFRLPASHPEELVRAVYASRYAGRKERP